MNYQQAVEYLYERLPMFHRIGKAAYKADLYNTIALCGYLGNPQQKFRTIHVAGTNGKGSTSHLLAAILQSAGYRTGLYTSPHLKSFTERIRINGKEIPENEVVSFVENHQSFIEQLHPSFFEMTVGMAFSYFASQQVDVAVIEVGLGGRLDSTNIISPQLSVITNISFDHQDILGDTLPKIALEKAGIIKPRTPVVISEYQAETAEVFIEKARQQESPLYFATDAYRVELVEYTGYAMLTNVWRDNQLYLPGLVSQLAGGYQIKNLAGVLKAIDLLLEQEYNIPEQAIRQGVSQVNNLTGLKGRWQVLNQHPLIICDTAHNEAGLHEVVTHISRLDFDRLYVVIGMVNDKDLSHILPLLPEQAYYYFCQAQIPRALAAETLQAYAAVSGLQGEVVHSVNHAIHKARLQATDRDMIFIGGSNFVVAEIDEL